MVSVVLGWAAGLALNSFGCVQAGAKSCAWRSLCCGAGRRGWRILVSLVLGWALGLALRGFGGGGPGAEGGA